MKSKFKCKKRWNKICKDVSKVALPLNFSGEMCELTSIYVRELVLNNSTALNIQKVSLNSFL